MLSPVNSLCYCGDAFFLSSIGVLRMADNAPTVSAVLLYLPKQTRTHPPPAPGKAGRSLHGSKELNHSISYALFYTDVQNGHRTKCLYSQCQHSCTYGWSGISSYVTQP